MNQRKAVSRGAPATPANNSHSFSVVSLSTEEEGLTLRGENGFKK